MMKKKLLTIITCCLLIIILCFFVNTHEFEQNADINEMIIKLNREKVTLSEEQEDKIKSIILNIKYRNCIESIDGFSLKDNPLLIDMMIDDQVMHFVLGEKNLIYKSADSWVKYKIINADEVYREILDCCNK